MLKAYHDIEAWGNDVIRSHKSQTQHRQYLELEEDWEAEEANPLYILWAVAPEG